jgi:putative phosphoesterase
MKIGVISDTHNYLDPKVARVFEGVEHILHGGDIGQESIILELEQIAPVTAVLGNNDLGLAYRETEVLTLADRKFLVHHIVDVRDPAALIHRSIDRAKPEVVVFGHTHKPFNEVIHGTLYFNPGYAGKPRFKLERSVAVLHCEPSGVRAEFHEL